MARTGRPTEYDDEEDAVLLNTEGQAHTYTVGLLAFMGYEERSSDALTARRRLLRRSLTKPATNELDRLEQVKRLRMLLSKRAEMAAHEEEYARNRVREH